MKIWPGPLHSISSMPSQATSATLRGRVDVCAIASDASAAPAPMAMTTMAMATPTNDDAIRSEPEPFMSPVLHDDDLCDPGACPDAWLSAGAAASCREIDGGADSWVPGKG